MCQRMKRTNWKLREEKVHLLDIMKTLKNLEYIFLVKGRIEISRDITFDEYVTLGKARDLPPPLPPPP